MTNIKEQFEEIEDPRHQGYIKHKLIDILFIVMCAVLCGLEHLEDIVIYGKSNRKFLEDTYGITEIPSKATLGRILTMIDGEKVGAIMIEIMKMQFGTDGEVIAVDGKAIRSTAKSGKPHSALQIITAYITSSGGVLGQKSIHEKTNEIPVFQEMLDTINIQEKIITADAMHCQKETCKKILEKGGNYLFGLKGNQNALYSDVKLFFEDGINDDCITQFRTIEKNAGRIEKRICRKTSDLSWLEGRDKWASLQTIFSIRRITTVYGKTTDQTCYYITSLNSEAKELMHIAREHWKIESLHWLLDVTFSEDTCNFLSENAHKTLNILRKFALATHKKYISDNNKKSTIKSNMFSALLNPELLHSIIKNL